MPPNPEPASVRWKIDEYSSYFDRMRFRGWCYSSEKVIDSVWVKFLGANALVRLESYGAPSPDIASAIDPQATQARFDEWVRLPESQRGRDFHLLVRFADGSEFETSSGSENAREGDPAHTCWYHFLDQLHQLKSGRLLEIGSRARSAITVRDLLPPSLTYTGMDIVDGPNVDLVGDAHGLSRFVPRHSFQAVFARSVFEHLAMPWKVVSELNAILELGGLVFITTHQTWVLHEEPWDYWRYSSHTWPCLFNTSTGFEILEVAQGEPARIHPMWDSPIVRDMPEHRAFLSSAVIARKTAHVTLDWPVDPSAIAAGHYPGGSLSSPPHHF